MPTSGEGIVAVCDVGGGSTEIVVGTALFGPAWVRSVNVGSLRLTARCSRRIRRRRAEIDAARAVVREAFAAVEPPRPELALATGGSARAIARVVGAHTAPASSSKSWSCSRRPAAATPRSSACVHRARTLLAGALVLQRSHVCSARPSRRRAAGSARARRYGSPRTRRRLGRSRPLEDRQVALVGEERRPPPPAGATGPRRPLGRFERARPRPSSATSARPCGGRASRGSASTAAQPRAGSGSPSPPRPHAGRTPRRSRRVRPFPSGTSSRRTSGGARRVPGRRVRRPRRPRGRSCRR